MYKRQQESASNIDEQVKSLIPEIVKKIESDSGTRLSEKTVHTLLGLSNDEFNAARIGAKQAAGWIMREKRISKETLDAAEKEAGDIVRAQHASLETKAAMLEIVQEQISPNLVLNPGKVEQARESAEKQVKPVMILKGQTIIRRGEIATPDHIDILHDLGLLSPAFDAVTLACIMVMIVVLLSGMGVYLYLYRRDIFTQTKTLLILGTVTVLTVFLIAVISSIPWEGAGFLVPASLGTMLIAIPVSYTHLDVYKRQANQGVKAGVPRREVDSTSLARAILAEFPNLSWVGVHLKGTTVNIEVAEKALPLAKSGITHLVAAEDALVTLSLIHI